MNEPDRAFWLAIRQALLMALNALERWLEIKPTTADLRKQARGR